MPEVDSPFDWFGYWKKLLREQCSTCNREDIRREKHKKWGKETWIISNRCRTYRQGYGAHLTAHWLVWPKSLKKDATCADRSPRPRAAATIIKGERYKLK